MTLTEFLALLKESIRTHRWEVNSGGFIRGSRQLPGGRVFDCPIQAAFRQRFPEDTVLRFAVDMGHRLGLTNDQIDQIMGAADCSAELLEPIFDLRAAMLRALSLETA